MGAIPGYPHERPVLTPEERITAQRRVKSMMRVIGDEITHLPVPALRSIIPVLAQAQREVEADLLKWLSTKSGDTKFTTQAYRQVLMQLRTAREGIRHRVLKQPRWVESLTLATRRALEQGSIEAGALASAHVMDEIATFDRLFGSFMPLVDINVVSTIAEGHHTLVNQIPASAARYAQNVWTDVKVQISVGMAKNESFNDMVERLVGMGGPKGTVALRGIIGQPGAKTEAIAEGLFKRYRGWAERLVRTEVIGAYNYHADNLIEEVAEYEPKVQRRWDAGLDRRTCLLCRGLHRQVRDIGERFSDGSMRPPAHPNCRCAVLAWHKDWFENKLPGDDDEDHTPDEKLAQEEALTKKRLQAETAARKEAASKEQEGADRARRSAEAGERAAARKRHREERSRLESATGPQDNALALAALKKRQQAEERRRREKQARNAAEKADADAKVAEQRRLAADREKMRALKELEKRVRRQKELIEAEVRRVTALKAVEAKKIAREKKRFEGVRQQRKAEADRVAALEAKRIANVKRDLALERKRRETARRAEAERLRLQRAEAAEKRRRKAAEQARVTAERQRQADLAKQKAEARIVREGKVTQAAALSRIRRSKEQIALDRLERKRVAQEAARKAEEKRKAEAEKQRRAEAERKRLALEQQRAAEAKRRAHEAERRKLQAAREARAAAVLTQAQRSKLRRDKEQLTLVQVKEQQQREAKEAIERKKVERERLAAKKEAKEAEAKRAAAAKEAERKRLSELRRLEVEKQRLLAQAAEEQKQEEERERKKAAEKAEDERLAALLEKKRQEEKIREDRRLSEMARKERAAAASRAVKEEEERIKRDRELSEMARQERAEAIERQARWGKLREQRSADRRSRKAAEKSPEKPPVPSPPRERISKEVSKINQKLSAIEREQDALSQMSGSERAKKARSLLAREYKLLKKLEAIDAGGYASAVSDVEVKKSPEAFQHRSERAEQMSRLESVEKKLKNLSRERRMAMSLPSAQAEAFISDINRREEALMARQSRIQRRLSSVVRRGPEISGGSYDPARGELSSRISSQRAQISEIKRELSAVESDLRQMESIGGSHWDTNIGDARRQRKKLRQELSIANARLDALKGQRAPSRQSEELRRPPKRRDSNQEAISNVRKDIAEQKNLLDSAIARGDSEIAKEARSYIKALEADIVSLEEQSRSRSASEQKSFSPLSAPPSRHKRPESVELSRFTIKAAQNRSVQRRFQRGDKQHIAELVLEEVNAGDPAKDIQLQEDGYFKNPRHHPRNIDRAEELDRRARKIQWMIHRGNRNDAQWQIKTWQAQDRLQYPHPDDLAGLSPSERRKSLLVTKRDQLHERERPGVDRRHTLRKGRPFHTQPIGDKGANESLCVYVQDEKGEVVKGVWKSREGEAFLRGNIRAGEFYKREIAAYQIAQDMGVGDLVPRTVERNLRLPGREAKERGSLQEFVLKEIKDPADNLAQTMRRSDAERVRIFDFITGNSDRHGGNILWTKDPRGGHKPMLIDNGLMFPAGAPERFVIPGGMAARKNQTGPLTPEARRQIDKIDLEKVARKLHDNGIDAESIRQTLYRAEAVKVNPKLMEVEPIDPEGRIRVEQLAEWQYTAYQVDKHTTTTRRAEIDQLVADIRTGKR